MSSGATGGLPASVLPVPLFLRRVARAGSRAWASEFARGFVVRSDAKPTGKLARASQACPCHPTRG